MMFRRSAIAAAIVAACSTANAGDLARAYADKANNVHIVTAAGKDVRLTSDRRAEDVRLSPDGEIATWLVTPRAAIDGRKWPRELRVYHRGRTGAIKCSGIIREYWFWKQGMYIATDCGGMHFAGIETLYDARSLQPVDRFDQAEVPVDRRPEWSTSNTGNE